MVTCIDPFYPDLAEFESLLVVDALVTDENLSGYVRLSRTVSKADENPEKVTGAMVTITDDDGSVYPLTETKAGEYRTDTLTFRGEPGKSYTLYIRTSEGNEYQSKSCLMHPVTDIDSIYYRKDTDMTGTGGETQAGVRFFIDSGEEGVNPYFRWTYEEWWKFHVPEVKKFDYLNDSTIIPVNNLKATCWAYRKSDKILIDSKITYFPSGFRQKAIAFLPTDQSSRFTIQYCMVVKQLSVSADEYEFWSNMQQINESGGDIFEKQPFPVNSNVYNLRNSSEPVLGYFQVSSVKQKRIYVKDRDITDMGLPCYMYDCGRIEKGEVDYVSVTPPGVTFDKIYGWYTSSGYAFIEPLFTVQGKLLRLVFVPDLCADCTLSGSLTKPDFWVDLD